MTPLEESIEHWKRLATGTTEPDEGIGMKYCALCQAYAHDDLREEECCIGCPVQKKTGRRWCEGSPYSEISAYTDLPENVEKTFDDIKTDPEFQRLAKLELEFLQSLLCPPDHTTT